MTLWTWTVPQAPQNYLHDRADIAILKTLRTEGQECMSRNQLQRLIDEGRVTADGVPIQARTHLKSGSLIRIDIPAPQLLDLTPENRPIEILYEDEHLLVLNKPPQLTVHPSTTQMEGTLVHALLHHIKDLSGIGGTLRPGIVHRIDKNTSGALVITKHDRAHQKLVETFVRHEIERRYWALCYGAPPPDAPAKIESLIGRSTQDRKKMSMKVKTGKRAVSYFKSLQKFARPHSPEKPFASFLEVTLETGRTHQVRVHLTGIGHSLLGDPTYGTPTEKQAKWLALPEEIRTAVEALPGQALHARVLGFRHPITDVALYFEAPPPPSFAALLTMLENWRPIPPSLR